MEALKSALYVSERHDRKHNARTNKRETDRQQTHPVAFREADMGQIDTPVYAISNISITENAMPLCLQL
jgi:hypothetical protein